MVSYATQHVGWLNTCLLIIIVFLLFLIGKGLKSFAEKFYKDFETALREIKDIKITLARHNEAIETLKEHQPKRR